MFYDLGFLVQIQKYLKNDIPESGIKIDLNNEMNCLYSEFLLTYLTDFLNVQPSSFVKYFHLIKKILYYNMNINFVVNISNFSLYYKLIKLGIIEIDMNYEAINKLLFMDRKYLDNNTREIIFKFNFNSTSGEFQMLIEEIKSGQITIDNLLKHGPNLRIYLPDIFPYLYFLGNDLVNVKPHLMYSLYGNERALERIFIGLIKNEQLLSSCLLDSKFLRNKYRNIVDPRKEIQLISYSQSYKIFNRKIHNNYYYCLLYGVLNLNFSLLEKLSNVTMPITELVGELFTVYSNIAEDDRIIKYPLFGLNDNNIMTLLYLLKGQKNPIFLITLSVILLGDHFSFHKVLNNNHFNVFQVKNRFIKEVEEKYFLYLNNIIKKMENVSFHKLFADCNQLVSITFPIDFDTSAVVDMSYMFANCQNLSSINVDSFDTSKVSNMSNMFFQCTSLSFLNLSSFDTSNVVNMQGMFAQCSRLISLNISNFDTAKVSYTNEIFANCISLKNIICSDKNINELLHLKERVTMIPDVSLSRTMSERDKLLIKLSNNWILKDEIGQNRSTVYVKYRNITRCFINQKELDEISRLGDFYDRISFRDMFEDCSKLEELIIPESFRSLNVIDTSYMFSGCSSIKTICVDNIYTSNVTTVKGMFNKCSSLRSVNLVNFITSSVIDFSFMFFECNELRTIDVSSFDTSDAIDMSFMFYGCKKLYSLDLSNFDTKKVTTTESMFSGCASLRSLDVTSFDTDKVTNMSHMFYNCESLESLDLHSFSTANVSTMEYMFSNCASLTLLDLSSFQTFKVKTMECIFDGCKSVLCMDLLSFNTSGVTNMKCMFNMCSSLTRLDLKSFKTANVYTMEKMFLGCSSLKNLDLRSFNTSRVENMTHMFSRCHSLVSINIASFNTSNVIYMEGMFSNCKCLDNLDLKSFDTSNVSNMSYMFKKCISLTSVCLETFNTENVTDMSNMFYKCSRLTSLDLASFKTGKVTDMKYMFAECECITELDLSSFDTSGVMNMQGMFDGCINLSSINLSNFDTSNVTNMSYMFNKCLALRSIDLTSFNTSNVTDMEHMFSQCPQLENLNLTSFDTRKVKEMRDMFDKQSNIKYIIYHEQCFSSISNLVDTIPYPIGIVTSYKLNEKMKYLMQVSNDWVLKEERVNDQYTRVRVTYRHYNAATIRKDAFTELEKLNDFYSDISLKGLFQNCRNIKHVGIPFNFGLYDITDLSYMFYGCSSLKSVDLGSLQTSSVVDTSYMFHGCSSLSFINVENFDTKNVTNMKFMFNGCSALSYLDLKTFDTQNVTDMSCMFSSCHDITILDLSSFNTEKCTNMKCMFNGMSNLRSLDLSEFNTSNVEDMSYMFYGCSKLTTIKKKFFYILHSANTKNMFTLCPELTRKTFHCN